MTPISKEQHSIIRTERGLTIAGTRITLYGVMDYFKSQFPSELIGDILNLTDQQVVALSYIETNRSEVEAEYQTVLEEAEAIRQYWEERNRDRLAAIAKLTPPPGRKAAWEKQANPILRSRFMQLPYHNEISDKI